VTRAFRLILVLGLPAVQAAAQWTPELSLKVETVGDVTASPDGKLVAWTQRRAVTEGEKSEMLTHIWLARAGGDGRRQFTFGEKSATAPAFSPDG